MPTPGRPIAAGTLSEGVPLIPVHSTTIGTPSIHAGFSGVHRTIPF